MWQKGEFCQRMPPSRTKTLGWCDQEKNKKTKTLILKVVVLETNLVGSPRDWQVKWVRPSIFIVTKMPLPPASRWETMDLFMDNSSIASMIGKGKVSHSPMCSMCQSSIKISFMAMFWLTIIKVLMMLYIVDSCNTWHEIRTCSISLNYKMI